MAVISVTQVFLALCILGVVLADHPRDIQKRQAPAPNTPGFSCNPGENFKHKCNTCRCSADGKTAACTYEACPPGSYRKKRQTPASDQSRFKGTPNESFKYECNICTCNSDGTDAACTYRECRFDNSLIIDH